MITGPRNNPYSGKSGDFSKITVSLFDIIGYYICNRRITKTKWRQVMKIEYMREYIVLANALNFTSAASMLYITQPALSRHIALIEEEIGTQLFKRTKHYVILTPTGAIVLNTFKQLVDQYDEMQEKISRLKKGLGGELRIAVPQHAVGNYMPSIIGLFKSKFPNIHLFFQVTEPSKILEELLNDSIDIGLVGNIDRKIKNAHIRYSNINRERLLLMVSDKHRLAGMNSVDISELVDETIIVTTGDESFADYVYNILKNHGISMRQIISDRLIDAISYVLYEINSVMIVPSHFRNNRSTNVVFVELSNEELYLDMALVYNINNNNPAIPIFIQQTEQLYDNTGHEANQ